MNHYQQQPYAHPGAPVPPYYAARQRFEQQQAQAKTAPPVAHQPYASGFRSKSLVDLSQPPPQHPQRQQQRSQPGVQPGAGVKPQPQPQSQAHTPENGRPQPQYQTQRPLYQPPYASQVQYGQHSPTRTQPAYGQGQPTPSPTQTLPSPAAALPPGASWQVAPDGMSWQPSWPRPAYGQPSPSPTRTQPPYAPQQQPRAPYAPQRTYSVPTPGPSPTPAPSSYQAQQPHHASPYASARPQVAQQQAQHAPAPTAAPAPQATRRMGQPFAQPGQPQPVQAPPLVAAQSAGARRPLPSPVQGRPRPMSMPPQPPPTSSVPTAPVHGTHNFSSSSLSHIIPQSSFPSSAHRPTSAFPPTVPPAPRSESPTRRPLPSPTPSTAPLPAVASSFSRTSGVPRTANMNFPRTPSPEKQPQSIPEAIGISSTSSSPTRPTAQGRALPSSPAAPPDLSQIQRGSQTLARRGTVSAMVSRFGGTQDAPSALDTLPAKSSYGPRPPTRASTIPAATVADAVQSFVPGNRNGAEAQGNSDEDEYATADEEAPSADLNVIADHPLAHTPSPQYGILDLPKRNTAVFRNPSPEAAKLSEAASPQYGIKELPVRSKSVIDRRIAWERAEQGITSSTKSGSSTGGRASATQPPSPSKSAVSSSPAKSMANDTNIHRSTALPPRSPQPQTPQQERELPMPVVHHPQPSYTDRKPSWSLPTADLEKIQERTHSSGQMTSNAFRFAATSLSEERKAAPTEAVAKPPVQTPALPRPPQIKASGPPSPKKPYSFTPRIPPAVMPNVDLSLDDAPPPSLRRSQSPAPSNSSSSVPSIPTIRTPEDAAIQQVSEQRSVPVINLPGDAGYDDITPSVPAIQVHVTGDVVSPKPTSPRKPPLPIINVPDDEDDISGGSGPVISITGPAQRTPKTPQNPMPIILNDLTSSGSRPHALPQAHSDTSSSLATSSSSRSELRSKRGGLVCGGCEKSILGRIVSAMGLRWHPQCFKCCTCGELLEHVSSYEHEGKPYCHLDYHELYAPQCYHCKTPIIDERFITLDDPALGKRTYHEQHFFCAECGDPFLAPSQAKPRPLAHTAAAPGANPNEISIRGDGAFDVALDEDGAEVGFTVYRGHPYCETCHVRLRAPRCRGCKRSIRDGDRAVEALGGKWCFACFVCTMCQKPFEDPSFFQRDKKPYCEPCFSIILRNEI